EIDSIFYAEVQPMGVWCELVKPPVDVAGHAELRDATGALAGENDFFFRGGRDTLQWIWFTAAGKNTSGELTLTIKPDPRVALRMSADVEAIYGKTLVRKVKLVR